MDGLLGKIVRLNPDGTIPKDNPFAATEGVRHEIWSLGHRNLQRATLHPQTGELWEAEHGTRGGDEINIARKGKDYGWPTNAYGIEYRGAPITGDITQKERMKRIDRRRRALAQEPARAHSRRAARSGRCGVSSDRQQL